MNTINQCRVKEIGPVRWTRIEWLPAKEAKVGNIVKVDGVVIRDNQVFKDASDYEVVTVYDPALPDDIFKKQDRK